MVSQPFMRRILRTGICLLGLSAVFAACGQNEGGRCQVNSDCASGLTCDQPLNGNGICRRNVSTVSTADAATEDSRESSSSLDLGEDVVVSSAIDLGSVDAESVDAGGID